jgi:hypothetical protein
MRKSLDWQPFFDIAAKDLSYEEKLDGYVKIAEERLERDRFEEFCAKHLHHLDDVANDFFQSTEAKDAVRKKTAALFPAHEVEKFTELFWQRIQTWRASGLP